MFNNFADYNIGNFHRYWSKPEVIIEEKLMVLKINFKAILSSKLPNKRILQLCHPLHNDGYWDYSAEIQSTYSRDLLKNVWVSLYEVDKPLNMNFYEFFEDFTLKNKEGMIM